MGLSAILSNTIAYFVEVIIFLLLEFKYDSHLYVN